MGSQWPGTSRTLSPIETFAFEVLMSTSACSSDALVTGAESISASLGMPQSVLNAFSPASSTARSRTGRLDTVASTNSACSKAVNGPPVSSQFFA